MIFFKFWLTISDFNWANPLKIKFENVVIYDLPVIIIFAIFTIIITIWSIVILYQGFKTATNCKEVRHNVYFGLAIVLADVLSRFLISNLN